MSEPDATSAHVSVYGLATMVLRRWRVVAVMQALLLLIMVVPRSLGPREWMATATFMPQSAQGQRNVAAGVAAQLGFQIGAPDPGQSPAFYVDLLSSREILGAAVDSVYVFAALDDTLRGTLVELFSVRGDAPERRREKAIRILSRAMTVSRNRETGVVGLHVRMQWPELSRQVADRLLALLNEFNLQRRRSQAAAEADFVADRVASARQELQDAEQRLIGWLQRNREFRNSSELSFQHDRLTREVGMRQEVYTTLAQAFEQARIDQVRDTPVITVVERPVRPVRPNGRGRLGAAVVALALGGLLGAAVALVLEALERGREAAPADYARFVTARSELTRGLRRLWRRGGPR